MRTIGTALAAVTAALLLSACATTTAPSGHDGHDGPASTAEAGTADQADVMFAQMMIPHHAQAVEMSDLVLAKDDIPAEVRELAEGIKAAQQPEIDLMRGWLEEWGVEEMPGGDHGMAHGDGMMSQDDLDALEAATGEVASRLFLEQMIEHHEGAIDMAEAVLEDGEDPDVAELAEQIIETQTAEIDEMRELPSASP